MEHGVSANDKYRDVQLIQSIVEDTSWLGHSSRHDNRMEDVHAASGASRVEASTKEQTQSGWRCKRLGWHIVKSHCLGGSFLGQPYTMIYSFWLPSRGCG